jgi:hypothetical protein
MQQALDSRFRAVEVYVDKVTASAADEELKSYLYRFSAVLICGNIERSVEIIVLGRLQHRAHPRVLNFVKSYFARGRNLDCLAIEELLNRFDSDWYRKFTKFVEDNHEIKEGVASCYAVRNSVAHGGNQGVGAKRVKELLAISKRLLDGVVNATA